MKELKVIPRNRDSEEYVLGSIMLEPSCLPLVIERLHEDVFYFDLHRYVFRAINSLYNESTAIDVITVIERMNQLKLIGGSINVFDVTKLTNDVVSSANIEAHVLILVQYYLQREAIRLGQQMYMRGYDDDPFDTLDAAAAEIIRLQESATRGVHRTIVDHVVSANKERDAILENGGVIGTSTGMERLDQVINGLVAPDLIIVAARPGMGKTALALTMLHHVSVNLGEPSGIFTLEMSETQVITRLESIDSGVDHAKIRQASMNEHEWKMLQQADARIARSPIHIDGTASINVRELRTKASIWKRKYGIKHIFVDYLQLMSGVNEKGKIREQVISEISRGLKMIAKELDCCVVALSQLSRAVEQRPDKMPQLSDLRESGSIEQDADEVIFLMRPEYYESTEPVDIGGETYNPKGLVITKIAKNRHGDTRSIPLYFNGPKMTFTNDSSYYTSSLKRIPANFYETDDRPF